VSHKRAILRARADFDIQDAVDSYLDAGAPDAALNFVAALEQAIRDIGRHPAIGSTRYAHELDLPGVRCWHVRGFPYLLFYIERADHIDVWRVLHGSRDIPAWLDPGEWR
jgi:toxin ParE1/3/4